MLDIIKIDDGIISAMLEVQSFKEGDYIVSYCPALELSSFGTTNEEAQQGLQGALKMFLEETYHRETLAGWSLTYKTKL